MPPRPPVPVVAAVLEDGAGRILLARRGPRQSLPLKWEFPGGKIEPGETPPAALARELAEELGIAVTTGRSFPVCTHDYGHAVVELHPFACRLAPGSPPPAAREHIALAWVTPAELAAYDLAPADWPVVEALGAARPSEP